MLPISTMPGDTPLPVSYCSSGTGDLKGLSHHTQSYSLYSSAEANGAPQSGRPPLRNSHFLDSADSPVSPRTHQPDINAPWGHQRSALDHRAALEPPIVRRDISHSSPGIPSNSPAPFARPPNAIHPGHVPPPAPLSRERETFEMRPYVSADRMLQHPPALHPLILSEHQPKSFPPHHQDYIYSQAGTTSLYSRLPSSTPGGEFARPYPPPFDSRAQHTNTPGYPLHLERRNTVPHQLGVNMYSEPRRESHTPTTMSPPQDYVRIPSGQSSNYISTPDPRHQNYRLHQSTHEVSHNDLIHSPPHNNMDSRQLDFSLRQHSTGSILEPSRVMNQKYNAPSQSTAILGTKQVTGEGFEPPSKRVKTEEHGSTGQSTGDISDQDTEGEGMYGAEERAGSGTPDPKKRKYLRKSFSRPPIQRNRGTTRINPEDLDEDQLPAYVDGVRVNKEWGLTKAGKARQRLPQACIACRKKKIKCMYVIQFPNSLAKKLSLNILQNR
ncbi:hypothetical protein BGX38DRAFT_620382 [Terfezia claveryi]|nr:hypothetical protein BGX38DRAFT_620382 [Terfezia claveryi]